MGVVPSIDKGTVYYTSAARKAQGRFSGACGAGGGVRLTADEVRYLQAIMRRGLETLSEAGACSDALFGALRQMAQERLGVQIRSEKLL